MVVENRKKSVRPTRWFAASSPSYSPTGDEILEIERPLHEVSSIQKLILQQRQKPSRARRVLGYEGEEAYSQTMDESAEEQAYEYLLGLARPHFL